MYKKGGMQPTPGTVNTNVSANYPAKDSVIVREPAAKKNIMTFNLGGMVKSQTNNLKNKMGFSKGGSTVNKAGNYTKPGMRKKQFSRIKAGGKGGAPGQWSARKAQMLAKAYKSAGGGYKS